MKTNRKSVLDSTPKDLTELTKAVELCQRAAKIGFDWPSINPVFNKLEEEISELKSAIAGQNKEEMLDELGDVLFVITNMARHLGVNPELAIINANKKFKRRFKAVEAMAREKYPQKRNVSLNILEKLWDEVKILETSNIMKD